MPYLRGADAILFVFDLTDPDVRCCVMALPMRSVPTAPASRLPSPPPACAVVCRPEPVVGFAGEAASAGGQDRPAGGQQAGPQCGPRSELGTCSTASLRASSCARPRAQVTHARVRLWCTQHGIDVRRRADVPLRRRACVPRRSSYRRSPRNTWRRAPRLATMCCSRSSARCSWCTSDAPAPRRLPRRRRSRSRSSGARNGRRAQCAWWHHQWRRAAWLHQQQHLPATARMRAEGVGDQMSQVRQKRPGRARQ